MITLEKLAPYLPHEVKVWHKERIMKMVTAQGASRHWIGIGAVLSAQQYYGPKPKLILRPLSDLTKPITVPGYNDGKEFVPIVELAKINNKYLPDHVDFYTSDWSGSSISEVEDMTFNAEYIVKTGNVGDLVYQFSYWKKNQRFALRDNTRGKPLSVCYQLKMFKMLYKWHFAVEIEESDYIDINTLKS